MEWLQDIAGLFVVGVLLYALAGDALTKLGLKPFLLSSLQVALELAHVLVGWIRVAMIWFGYGLILGRENWRRHTGYVEKEEVVSRTPPAPRTDSAPRVHAENTGAEGARTPPAPANSSALTPDLISLIQRIAAHKIVRPADGKEATGKALGFTKSGTSAAWQSYSHAWNLLYPPPPAPTDASEPEAWESNGKGVIQRIRTAAR